MSLTGELTTMESLKSEENAEPFKKRFKTQLTAADLCKVVIDNNSSDEEDIVRRSSSEDDYSATDSSGESELEAEEVDPRIIWRERPPPRSKMEYKLVAGLKVPPLGQQPRDFFNLLMNRSMYGLIVKNTNAYATAITKSTDGAKIWKPLKEEEMKKFLGLLYLIGVVKLPSLSLYWSTDRLFSFPAFRQVMSLERFLAILHSLRFCDDSVSDPTDPLRKVRPLIDFFDILMETIYTPQKELVLNNPMRIGKSTEGRVQAFTICESCGMVQKYLLYETKRGDKEANRQNRHVVVKDLLEGKLDRGHSVFMGEYFTSVPLIQSLNKEKTYITGQISEKNWKAYNVSSALIDKEEVFQTFTNDGVCLLKWKDKRKEIACVSSAFDATLSRALASQEDKTSNLALVEYNRIIRRETKRLRNQIFSYPPTKRKLKWYRKVGLHIINIVMINSYHLYSRYSEATKMSLLNFRLNLIKTLLYPSTDFGEAIRPESPGGYPKPHVLDYVGRNDKGFRKRKRCKYCISERGIRVDSYYHCITCDHQPGFCLGQCFIKYHKYDLFV